VALDYEQLAVDVACRPCPAKLSASPGPRGVKRERPSSPKVTLPLGEISDTVDGAPELKYLRQDMRRHNWPVLKNEHSAILDGGENLAVQTIAFSSDGSHFALACKPFYFSLRKPRLNSP
jgi:hypothetical protein